MGKQTYDRVIAIGVPMIHRMCKKYVDCCNIVINGELIPAEPLYSIERMLRIAIIGAPVYAQDSDAIYDLLDTMCDTICYEYDDALEVEVPLETQSVIYELHVWFNSFMQNKYKGYVLEDFHLSGVGGKLILCLEKKQNSTFLSSLNSLLLKN